jgi:hypothetical protein
MTLEEKLNAFYNLQLPGQPKFMHMGTMRLVRDLEKEIYRLTDLCEPNKVEDESLKELCNSKQEKRRELEDQVRMLEEMKPPNFEEQNAHLKAKNKKLLEMNDALILEFNKILSSSNKE